MRKTYKAREDQYKKEASYGSAMHVYDVFMDVTIKYMLVFLLCNYYFFFDLGDNTGPVM